MQIEVLQSLQTGSETVHEQWGWGLWSEEWWINVSGSVSENKVSSRSVVETELVMWERSERWKKCMWNEMLFIDPGWVRSMWEDSGNQSGMADNLKCNHEWKKYEPRSMVFLPKIPESECSEMVMLYSPVYAYVYLNNYAFALPYWNSCVAQCRAHNVYDSRQCCFWKQPVLLCVAVWTCTWHTCTI